MATLFYKEIDVLLFQRGITVEGFAKRADMTPDQLTQTLSGEHDVVSSTLNSLAVALDSEWVLVPKEHLLAVRRLLDRSGAEPDYEAPSAAELYLARRPQSHNSDDESEQASDEVLSAEDAGKLLLIPREHVVNFIDSGVLPLHHRTVRDVYVRRADVVAHREQNKRETAARLDSQAKRHNEMLSSGALLSEEAFREQLGVSKKRMAAMVSDERIFALEVDNEKVFPAILCDSTSSLERLWKVAKIIAPAPPSQRLDFLTTACAALEDRVPVDMLADDRDYKQLRAFAKAWASELSRTSVVVWDADTVEDLSLATPLYTCSTEIDPRFPLWRRALNALSSPGYTHPVEAPPAPSELVIVVERTTAGQGGAVPEAGFVCHLRRRVLRMTVHASDGAESVHERKLRTKQPSVVDVAKELFTLLAEVSRTTAPMDGSPTARKKRR